VNAESFTRAVGLGWLDSYEPIVKRRWSLPYDEKNEKWHHQRRGRYVEFNLLYDRGVRFGLDGGRVESIMVSAPPRVRWDYDATPKVGSEEARLVEVLRNPKEW
jgi:coproporphyrinogen III oxidase